MTAVTCIRCTRTDAKAEPKMARLGFCSCAAVPVAGQTFSVDRARDCNHFVAAPAETIEKRIAWLANQGIEQRPIA